MKKFLLIAVALLLIAGGAGAAWWKYGRKPDAMTQARMLVEKGDIRGAMIELRNAVRDHPESSEAHLRLGVLQLQSGDAVAAEKELKAAREAGSGAVDIPVMLAQAYLQQGRNKELLAEFVPPAATPELSSQLLILRSYAQAATNSMAAAVASLTAAERLAPNSANPLVAGARLAVGRGDMATADQKVAQALRLDPKRADAMLLRGQIQNALGHRDEAMASLDGAVALSPRFAVARLERANLLITLNQDAKAKTDVDAVLADQPNYAAATYLRAVLQSRAGDDTNADLNFQKLSGVMQRFPKAQYFQAIVKYNLGQMEQATDSASRYVQRNPNDPAGVKLLARILLAAGRGDRALATLQAAVRNGTADAEMLDLLGRAYTMTGKPAQAVQSFDRAVTLSPANANILTHLASAKLGRVDNIDAGADITSSLKSAPDSGAPAEAPVVAALAAGDADAADKALVALRAQVGDTETVGLLQGAVLLIRQDFDGAVAQYQTLIAANPAQVRARVAMARVLMIQNKPADAERVLSEALAQDPANEEALGGLLQILLRDNRVSRAVAVIEVALAAAPNSPSLLLALSDLYVRAGTPDKALTLLDKAAPAFSQTAAALAARARVQVALQNLPLAQAAYNDVLKLMPGDTGTIAQLVDLQTQAKDWLGARATLEAALRVRPGDPLLLRLLVGIDLQSSGEPAARATIARLQADPMQRDGARTLNADLDVNTQHYLEAAEAYHALYKAQPTAFMAMSATNAYVLAGTPGPGAALLREWLDKHPDDVDVTRGMGTLEMTAGHNDSARALFEHVIALSPNDALAMNNLALIYQQQNNPRALELGRRAFLLAPSAQSADTLGWILMGQNDAAGAIPLLSQAATQLKDDPAVQFHYAAALKATGKRPEAIQILRPLADSARPFEEQPAARQMLRELEAAN